MKRNKLFLRQLRYAFRIAARLEMVRRIGIERLKDLRFQEILRRRRRPLHLIVYDAAVRERFIGAFDLVMPALLLQNLRFLVHRRIKHRIQINVHKVLEILSVAARHRIHRLIRECHRIEERIERALHQLDKRLLQGKLAGAAQDRMFYYMGRARIIPRRRAKGNGEYFIIILIFEKQQPRPALFMKKFIRRRVYFRHRPRFQ